MASVQTSAYQGRYLKLTVVEESYSIANNTSTLRWTLESTGGDASVFYTIYNWGVWVNGQQIYAKQTTNWQSASFPAKVGSATGTITVGHNADGTAPAVGFTLRGSVFVNSDVAYNGSVALTTIPRQANITSAGNFNDEQNPSFTFDNKANATLSCWLEPNPNGDHLAVRTPTGTGGTFTWNLTEAERNALRNKCVNSNSCTCRIGLYSTIGNNTFVSYKDVTMTIVNANPTFTNSQLSYTDTKASVVAITGDASKIVRNQSQLQVTFTGATAKKGASIVNYQLKFNGTTDTRTAPFTKDYGVVNIAENQKVQVVVTDSRGNKTTIEKTVTILDWVNPTAVITLGRKNNYEDQTNIKVQATCSSVNNKNSLQSIKYRYKKTTDTTYSADVTINNNTQYTFTISKNYAWNVQVVLTDKFGTTTYNLIVAKGKPILFIDINKLAVGINCFPTNNNSLALNDKDVLEYDVVDTW